MMCFCRYAIDDNSADWTAAEGQVRTFGPAGATVVSVKSTTTASGKKRKAGEDGGDGKGGNEKKTRRGKKVKR